MATKKKKESAPKRSVKASPRRRAARPAGFAPSPINAQPVERSSNGLFILLLLVGIVILGWLGMRSCRSNSTNLGQSAIAPTSALPPARSTANEAAIAAASAARSKAQASAAAAMAKKQGIHRSAADAPQQAAPETGAPSLTFDRGQSQAFEVRCWRSADSPAQLDVFAPRNRLVRSLKSEAGAAGMVKLKWDGKDEAGKKVPVGLYFLRPSQEGEQSIRDIWVKG